MSATQTDLRTPIHSFMRRQPITVMETDTIQDAVEKMTEEHLSALPVVDQDGCLKGIITVSDMLRLIQDAERTLDCDMAIYDESYLVVDLIRECLGSDEVASVMSNATVTAEQNDSLQKVAQLMVKHQVHHVPVINHDKRLLGIVSATDYVSFVAEMT
ncbi:CBS domain-containing protein [Aporhodopirellula aestuarii]|uniref:CBS domain-containing protein n=1 Tax=Aporhodopirellula aestuarii TaxID=2950107 RepID=A0ABT0UBX8_9BACT|nr:CBS domain-containing protein [Aporhodopirellula aestuarii]MCM2374415.1 CBS domain-containing protein [Aporhodopirellula aestuarii]